MTSPAAWQFLPLEPLLAMMPALAPQEGSAAPGFLAELSEAIETGTQSTGESDDTAEPRRAGSEASLFAVNAWPVHVPSVEQGTPPPPREPDVLVASGAAISKVSLKEIEPAQTRGELAFTLRVTPRTPNNPETPLPPAPQQEAIAPQNDKPATTPLPPVATAAVQHEAPKPASEKLERTPEEQKPEKILRSATADSASSIRSVETMPPPPARDSTPAPQVKEPTPTTSIDPVDTLREAPKPAPPRQIALRIEAPETSSSSPTSPVSRSVDLLVEQRGATMHFAVRSADPSLAGELRGSLNELTAKLEAQGFRAEPMRPADLAVAATDGGFLRQSGDGFDSNGSPDWSAGDGTPGQSSQERQDPRDQREDQQPDWFAELQKSLFAPGANANSEFERNTR